ncbi:membrane protein YfhO [Mucilaginibacter mallensis]|uniref:Membrane protein YfhO n=1 Tax=Mucilaginibacter mallensis TaxID=652787 RepID=A0A1H1NJ67_MUCMA|nr:YfhO family protein [Mucilaginibacter mallensis]SDR99034.1 membrane protein YfhO [Mucilaginibacter mallensis]
MNNWFKRNSTHLIIVALLIVIPFAYFFTPLMQGKALAQGDVQRAQSMQKEIMDTKAKTGHEPLWTNSMFGGMPSYQIHVLYPNNVTSYVVESLKTIFPNPVDTVLLTLLGAYLLLCVLRLNPWLAAAGALAFALSSYNFILIDAGHANQAFAIAFFAPIIAGIILTFRGKYLLGASLTALFLAMEIRANHIQMTYYLLISILILVIVQLYHAIKTKQLNPFGKSIIYLVAATLLAVAVNASMLWTTAEYGKETNRGPSNLTQHTSEPSNGLDKDYAYAWSQGVGECFTFLIPNAYGGASEWPTGFDVPSSNVTKALVAKGVAQDQASNIAQQLLQGGLSPYWGNKQFTGGPFYFGAVVCFLFILGLFIVKHRIKWWLLATVILTMLLSFGRNMPFVSDLFFNYFPMYNKFRAVESILAVAMLCFPVLGFMAVQEVIDNKDKAYIFKYVKIAFYITGGITLLLVVAPTIFFSFRNDQHQTLISGLTQAFKGDGDLATSVANGLVSDRIALERADAIRSLIFIVIAFGLLWAFIKQKINITVASIAFLLLTLIDMWGVDRRYLNDNNFVDKEDLAQPFKMRDVDQFILRDTDPDFRVFDLSQGDPFTNASTSYFYKSIGGYHAAKLKRYDELISNQFSKTTNRDVLDMLNTKYIIVADPKTGTVSMQANETACGHAWFVKSVKYAINADQEMQAISSFDPKNEAIVDQQYKSLIEGKNLANDPNSTITLTSYEPEHLTYQTGSATSQIAVFSEIYYKEGWKMYIDGVEQPYFRADYLLRAAVIPVGNHKVEFKFHPASYYVGEQISLAGSILLVLALGGVVYTENKKKPEVKKDTKKKA